MCSGLPEQGLAAALETSGDKAAAAAAAITCHGPFEKTVFFQTERLLEGGRNMKGTRKGV